MKDLQNCIIIPFKHQPTGLFEQIFVTRWISDIYSITWNFKPFFNLNGRDLLPHLSIPDNNYKKAISQQVTDLYFGFSSFQKSLGFWLIGAIIRGNEIVCNQMYFYVTSVSKKPFVQAVLNTAISCTPFIIAALVYGTQGTIELILSTILKRSLIAILYSYEQFQLGNKIAQLSTYDSAHPKLLHSFYKNIQESLINLSVLFILDNPLTAKIADVEISNDTFANIDLCLSANGRGVLSYTEPRPSISDYILYEMLWALGRITADFSILMLTNIGVIKDARRPIPIMTSEEKRIQLFITKFQNEKRSNTKEQSTTMPCVHHNTKAVKDITSPKTKFDDLKIPQTETITKHGITRTLRASADRRTVHEEETPALLDKNDVPFDGSRDKALEIPGMGYVAPFIDYRFNRPLLFLIPHSKKFETNPDHERFIQYLNSSEIGHSGSSIVYTKEGTYKMRTSNGRWRMEGTVYSQEQAQTNLLCKYSVGLVDRLLAIAGENAGEKTEIVIFSAPFHHR